VFSIKGGSRLATYPEPSDGACCVTWSPDGRFLAFITAYRVLHLWDPFGSRELTVELSPRSSSLAFAFSPDGNQLAVGVGSNVRMYSITP
jgi:WD40 repeat protein